MFGEFRMKAFIKKYSHAWTFLYIFIYMPWFMWLENNITPQSEYINMYLPIIDDKIPFCEWFIIPYLLWFLFVPAVMLLVFFTSKKEFYYASAYLFIGMTICLLICTLWPNGQQLRVESFSRNNILTRIMAFIYETDTNTNVFPSIHVFNSIAGCVILCKNRIMKDKKPVKIASVILSVLIILSTMFLKQHSVLDVAGGIVLSVVMYVVVYDINWVRVLKGATLKEKTGKVECAKEKQEVSL